MAEKSGPVFEGAVGLFPGTRQDNIPVLAIKPLSFELPAADSRVQAEHGTKGCEIAKKRKSAYLAYQQQRMDKISEQKSRSTSRESTARALEHERGNGAEEQIVHDRKGKGFYGGESEKIKWILSKYRSLLRRMAQQQEVMEPQDAPKKAPLHVEAANRLKPHWQKCAKKRIGPVPGVEVGDEFQYRIEMHIIGLHGPLQSGIDFLRAEDSSQRVSLATSIVVSGGYEDDIDNGDVLIYTGQGANDYVGNRKQIDDQKLTAENTALLNSWKFKRPVRVIRGFKFSKKLPHGNFRYDGLYNVEHCWHEKGCSGYLVYKFKLRRQRGQAPLAFHAVRFTGKSGNPNARQENVIKEDIGEGLDKSRISVVNAVDGVCSLDDFKYLVRVKYPDWLGKLCLSEGCRCVGGCNDVKNCLCARRNGGEFPYTRKGMLVRAKPVLYECGPSCRCPPTCANRVAQHGMKPRLEIFRTQSRNWGMRSLDFIEAGGFIVEYTGELTADPASDNSINNFIFPISAIGMEGNWGDLRGVVDDEVISAHPCQLVEDVGFKVDASRSGNASRFIGRSCRPNVFAQYVLYDHHDMRIPHVMLFASENISPQIELKICSSTKQSTNDRYCQKPRYGSQGRMGMRLEK